MSDQQPATDTQDTQDSFDFDAWLGEQPEHVRKGYEGKTSGLHSALEKERGSNKDMTKELRRLSGLVEQGSEAQKALGEMSTRLEQAERERDFIRDASKPEIGCVNPDTAFLVAVAKDLFNKRGEPDWAAIKAAAPELFGQRTKTPPGNAGNGVNSPPAQKVGMNEWIRKQAGYG